MVELTLDEELKEMEVLRFGMEAVSGVSDPGVDGGDGGHPPDCAKLAFEKSVRKAHDKLEKHHPGGDDDDPDADKSGVWAAPARKCKPKPSPPMSVSVPLPPAGDAAVLVGPPPPLLPPPPGPPVVPPPAVPLPLAPVLSEEESFIARMKSKGYGVYKIPEF